MNEQKIKEYNEHLFPTYNRFPIVLDHGKGVYLYDDEGNEYIDFMGGIAVNALGYANEGLNKAIMEQLGKLQHVSNLYFYQPVKDAAEKLSDITGFDQVFFVNSGAEANECAFKLARRHQIENKSEKATKIITMNGSFHGRTYATVTATGQPEYHKNFGPMLPDFVYVDFNNLEELEEALGDGEDTAAVILEPIRGEGGIIPADKEYLKKVRELCDKTNTLLIFDEVQCGAGRTGTFLASELYDVKPDILTLAKGIGGGFPVGACLANEDIAATMSPGTHGTTYGGNPLATTVVNYVVSQTSNPEFLEKVKENGKYFKEELEKLKNKYPDLIKEIRGEGLILGAEFSIPVGDVVNKNLENGLLTISAANNTMRFVPPLIIEKEEIGKGLKILDNTLDELRKNDEIFRK